MAAAAAWPESSSGAADTSAALEALCRAAQLLPSGWATAASGWATHSQLRLVGLVTDAHAQLLQPLAHTPPARRALAFVLLHPAGFF